MLKSFPFKSISTSSSAGYPHYLRFLYEMLLIAVGKVRVKASA